MFPKLFCFSIGAKPIPHTSLPTSPHQWATNTHHLAPATHWKRLIQARRRGNFIFNLIHNSQLQHANNVAGRNYGIESKN